LFAREKVRDDLEFEMPDVLESERAADFQVASLESLVRMKLLANRDQDRVHLRDLIEVDLVDRAFLRDLPPDLASRLETLLSELGR
jgi:hypothetical protein